MYHRNTAGKLDFFCFTENRALCAVLKVRWGRRVTRRKLHQERFPFHSCLWRSRIICVVICVVSRSQLKVSRCLQIKRPGPSAERADPNCSGQREELLRLCFFACTIQTCLCVEENVPALTAVCWPIPCASAWGSCGDKRVLCFYFIY